MKKIVSVLIAYIFVFSIVPSTYAVSDTNVNASPSKDQNKYIVHTVKDAEKYFKEVAADQSVQVSERANLYRENVDPAILDEYIAASNEAAFKEAERIVNEELEAGVLGGEEDSYYEKSFEMEDGNRVEIKMSDESEEPDSILRKISSLFVSEVHAFSGSSTYFKKFGARKFTINVVTGPSDFAMISEQVNHYTISKSGLKERSVEAYARPIGVVSTYMDGKKIDKASCSKDKGLYVQCSAKYRAQNPSEH